MSASHAFFADESGNAGINYLDDGQPFHVTAGFLIAAAHRAEAEAAIRAQFPRGEVKGKELLQSPTGQRRAIRLLHSIGANGGIPFFIAMERWFSVAGKLVDVFLDPAHQDSVDWLPTGDLAQREVITEKLLILLPREVLASFARAYRCPGVEPFRDVLQATIKRLETLGEEKLSHGFKGALNNLQYIVEQEFYGDTPVEHAEWAALNLPAFMHLIRNVDIMMDGLGTYDVVHDQVDQFKSVFAENIIRYRHPGATQPDIYLQNGRPHRVLFRNLASFTMADSKNTPMLQASDILASSVRRLLGSVLSDWKNPGKEMQELLRMIIPLWFEQDDLPISLGGISASEKTKEALMSALSLGFLLNRM